MLMTAGRAAEWCGGRRQGGDPVLAGVSIDSRHMQFGDLFVALPGRNTNGHTFVADAMQSGAAAAMVMSPSPAPAQIIVGDCETALVKLACSWRELFGGKVTAVTGSNGKTTVKEMLASICRAAAGAECAYHSRGNMNNKLGVSLSVLGMRPGHKLAVLETGMDAPGELTGLGGICRPQVAIINNAQRAHLGGFASLKEIACAKGELIQTLPQNGTAVLNADDKHLPLWKSMADGRNIVTFGFGDNADFRADYDNGELHLPGLPRSVRLKVAGEHNARNATAAAAAAQVLQLPPEASLNGLESFTGAPGRLQFKTTAEGAVLIDDTYNANPDSLNAALAVLAKCEGDKHAVLGDMLALGESSEREHKAAVEAAAAHGAKTWCVGELMKDTGIGAKHFSDKPTLVASLKKELSKSKKAAVLVKGSRGMQMETIVAALELEKGE